MGDGECVFTLSSQRRGQAEIRRRYFCHLGPKSLVVFAFAVMQEIPMLPRFSSEELISACIHTVRAVLPQCLGFSNSTNSPL